MNTNGIGWTTVVLDVRSKLPLLLVLYDNMMNSDEYSIRLPGVDGFSSDDER